MRRLTFRQSLGSEPNAQRKFGRRNKWNPIRSRLGASEIPSGATWWSRRPPGFGRTRGEHAIVAIPGRPPGLQVLGRFFPSLLIILQAPGGCHEQMLKQMAEIPLFTLLLPTWPELLGSEVSNVPTSVTCSLSEGVYGLCARPCGPCREYSIIVRRRFDTLHSTM